MGLAQLVKLGRSSSLIRGAGVYLFASVLNASIPFLLLPVLTRYLEPVEYGEIAVFQVWISLIGALCGLSVHGAANRKYFDYENPDREMGEFIGACVLLLIVSTIALAIIVYPFRSIIIETLGIKETWLWLAIPVAFSNFLIQLRLGQWQVRKKAAFYGTFQISRSLLDMLLSLVLVVVFTLGVTGRLSGTISAACIFGVIALLSLRSSDILKLSWRPDLMREALKFGVPLIPHILGAFLLLTADRAIISSKLGLSEAGVYMVAAQLAMAMSIMLEAVNKAFSPWLFERLKRDKESEKRQVVKFSYGYSAFLLFIAFVALIVGDDVLRLIAGDKYSAAGKVVGWLFLAQAFRGIYFLFTNYIFFAKRTGAIARITIFFGVLHIGFLYSFIDYFGVVGAAYALCISMFLQMLGTWYTANKLVTMPWMLK
ncbi:lipopolysaccharide biosynthesis protein [Idiomarina aminovorans]|uniref:lipopolysaccharide biosynthesis protein n=1 Tax=Idiomarina aminovorans TaxID=2914829 RepID=UPI00200326FF|nr:oligosaccharide flippase family protein [Idiomarina sp. ATCH4]MCK7459124.1 oligosaccharide flippase family protein [Idiomarina sp. ATCH4]